MNNNYKLSLVIEPQIVIYSSMINNSHKLSLALSNIALSTVDEQ